MNPHQLIANFEKISEAPNAVPRLRRFILDLAVRGKLLDQNRADGKASDVLASIQAEKIRLTKSGKIRPVKPLADIPDDEVPFAIPSSWSWVRLQDITSYIQRGKSPKYASAEGTPVISQRCVQWSGLDLVVAKLVTADSILTYEDVRFLRTNDLLWNSTGTGTIGRIIRITDPPSQLVCDSHVTVVRCLEVDAEYVRIWLRSDHVYLQIEDRAAGSTNQVELTAQMAINQVVPLPPVAEQHRIVAKVDELMALCDQLEAAQAEREARRNRLNAASLQRLNQPDADADEYNRNVRFHLNNFTSMNSRPEQIKAIRQMVLDLAVSGKLVVQHSNDEFASKLIRQIEVKKNKLRNDGKIKKTKNCRSFGSEFIPYKIPGSWEWTMLGEITEIGTGSTPSRGQSDFWYNGSIAWVTSGATSKATILECDEYVTDQAVKSHRLRLYPKGTLIVALYGQGKTRGQVATLGIDATINQACAAICPIQEFGEMHLYLKLLLDRNYEEMRSYSAGGPQPNLNVQKIKEFLVPLPPLAEQHRIVAKVNELMAVCDRLGAELLAARGVRGRLLEAVLSEALNSESPVADIDYQRAVLAAEIINQIHEENRFGHTKLMKIFVLCELAAPITKFNTQYYRYAAGPFNQDVMDSIDAQVKDSGWFEVENRDDQYIYKPLAGAGSHRQDYQRYFASHDKEIQRIIALLKPFKTIDCEIISTLYSAWNDLILQQLTTFSDDRVIQEASVYWHNKKDKINQKQWKWGMQWIRDNGLIPCGTGQTTKKIGS